MECELKIFFYLSLVLVFIMVHSAVCVYPCRSFNFYEVNNFNFFFLIWILNHFRNALTILRLWKISLMFSDFFFLSSHLNLDPLENFLGFWQKVWFTNCFQMAYQVVITPFIKKSMFSPQIFQCSYIPNSFIERKTISGYSPDYF